MSRHGCWSNTRMPSAGRTGRGDDQAQLTVALHPAHRSAHARVGQRPRRRRRRDHARRAGVPPLHRPRPRRLGFEQSISWSRDDPLNVTFGERPIVEQAYLSLARPAAGQGPPVRHRRSTGTATRAAGGHPLRLKVRSPRPWVPGTSPRAQGGPIMAGRRRHPVVGRRDRRTLPAEPGALPDVARRPLARPLRSRARPS